jgi:predicted alpha/beta-hydrolase family hydrolase
MTSQAQTKEPLVGVKALAFVAFPLHPAGKPADDRGNHLFGIGIAMLFLQGTNDALAELTLLRPLCDRLGDRATLAPLEGADHAFHVPARSGRTDGEVMDEALAIFARWVDVVVSTG